MKRLAYLVIFFCVALLTARDGFAGQIRVYVSEFAVTGATNKDELKATLQTLLASRLNSESVMPVDSPTGADLFVKGSYVVFGKVFSLDVVAKDPGGKVVARAFQQGESQDELIPAVGKLGQSLAADIAGKVTGSAAAPTIVPARTVQPAPASDIVKTDATPTSDIVKPQELTRTPGGGWISQRLGGALVGIAPGRLMKDGAQEYYLADEHALRLYRRSDGLKLVAEVTFSPGERILGIDSADLDGDGVPEAYLTIMDGESLASQVWVAANDSLKRVATKLPYFFRGIALDGKDYRMYAQQMSTDRDFYGDVLELVRNGDRFETKNPIKIPRFGHLYNFNRFRDASGTPLFVVLNADGYLVVSSATGEEMWRSSDKFGGSEAYFKREDLANVRTTGDPYRWVFLEQRITVTPAGDVIVPQNGGFFVLGNNRAYSKNSVFSFSWNGSSLDERWHTKTSQNYLADYFYDASKKEIVALEVVKKEGILSQGASVVAVKKVE